MPELVPLAARAGSDSASSSSTEAPLRASASASDEPTTPAPTTVTSVSIGDCLHSAKRHIDAVAPRAYRSTQKVVQHEEREVNLSTPETPGRPATISEDERQLAHLGYKQEP